MPKDLRSFAVATDGDHLNETELGKEGEFLVGLVVGRANLDHRVRPAPSNAVDGDDELAAARDERQVGNPVVLPVTEESA